MVEDALFVVCRGAVVWRSVGARPDGDKQAVKRIEVAVMISRVQSAFGMFSSLGELILHNMGNFTIVQVRAE